jgi:hypothetical protein
VATVPLAARFVGLATGIEGLPYVDRVLSIHLRIALCG